MTAIWGSSIFGPVTGHKGGEELFDCLPAPFGGITKQRETLPWEEHVD
jgi:hypothetical protein